MAPPLWRKLWLSNKYLQNIRLRGEKWQGDRYAWYDTIFMVEKHLKLHRGFFYWVHTNVRIKACV